MRRRRLLSMSSVPLAALVTLTPVAPPAQADPQSSLGQAIVALRSASSCPALQSDPLVTRVAAMASQSTNDYITHRSAAVPFTDPLPALSTIGYAGAKALLLSGYGPTQSDALHALVLQWQGLKPDCSYQQFGTNTWHGDAGFELASVVLATPAH